MIKNLIAILFVAAFGALAFASGISVGRTTEENRPLCIPSGEQGMYLCDSINGWFEQHDGVWFVKQQPVEEHNEQATPTPGRGTSASNRY